MGFREIQAWRDIMDAQDQEQRAYDQACAAAERRAQAAEQDEYDGIDQVQVDPDTCACGCGNDGCVCLDDLDDDEIDFSAYGVSESDLGTGPADDLYPTARDVAREPLVRLPAAMGRPASDADLAAQDVVSLMAEALKKAGRLDEVGLGTEPKEYKGEFGRSMLEFLNKAGAKAANAEVLIRLTADGKAEGLCSAVLKRYNDGEAVVARGPRSVADSVQTFLQALREEGCAKLSDVENLLLSANKGTSEDGALYSGLLWSPGENVLVINFEKKSDPDAWKKKFGDFLSEGLDPDDLLKEDDAADPAGGKAADEKIEKMADGDDYPLSDDDWDQIMEQPTFGQKVDMIQDKVKDRWDGLSPEARRRIRSEILDLRKQLLQSAWNERQFKEALRLQGVSKERELTDREMEKFGAIIRFNLTDEQRARLLKNVYQNGYRVPRGGRTAVVPSSDAQAGNVKDFAAGEGADEIRNETGLDATFDPEQFAYVPEPMQPGTKVPADFNPNYGPEDVQPNLAAQRDIDQAERMFDRKVGADGNYRTRKVTASRHDPAAEDPDAEGARDMEVDAYDYMSPEERRKADERGAIADALEDGRLDLETFYTTWPKQWMKIWGALEPDEIKDIKRELVDEFAKADPQLGRADLERMLDYMFGKSKDEGKLPRKPLQLKQQDFGASMGYGGDQKGVTGGVTQQGDNIINCVMVAFATYLNVGEDLIKRLWKNLCGQNTRDRGIRKEIRPVLFKEILDEMGVRPEDFEDVYGCVPGYWEDGVHRTEKKAADKLILALFAKEVDQMSPEDRTKVDQVIAAYADKKHYVKLGTGLDVAQNSEFQQLIIRMRDEGDLPDADRVRLMQLDYMRTHPGAGEDQAKAEAERRYAEMMKPEDGEAQFVIYTTGLAKSFVDGHSGGKATKDTIQVPGRARANAKA